MISKSRPTLDMIGYTKIILMTVSSHEPLQDFVKKHGCIMMPIHYRENARRFAEMIYPYESGYHSFGSIEYFKKCCMECSRYLSCERMYLYYLKKRNTSNVFVSKDLSERVGFIKKLIVSALDERKGIVPLQTYNGVSS